jgi:hypothetical protein
MPFLNFFEQDYQLFHRRGPMARSSLRVCLGEGKQLAGGGWSAVAGVGVGAEHRERESGAV